MQPLGARKKKQHAWRSSLCTLQETDNTFLARQGHRQHTLASTLPQVSAAIDSQMHNKGSSLQRQEGADLGGNGQPGRGFENRRGTEYVHLYFTHSNGKGLKGLVCLGKSTFLSCVQEAPALAGWRKEIRLHPFKRFFSVFPSKRRAISSTQVSFRCLRFGDFEVDLNYISMLEYL